MLHGHVGVELPQEIQPRAELADGGALDVLLEREGHLSEALRLFLVELGGGVLFVGVCILLLCFFLDSRGGSEEAVQGEPRAVRPLRVALRRPREQPRPRPELPLTPAQRQLGARGEFLRE